MTGPYVGGAYDQRYGSQSDIARVEYEQFMARQKQLMDALLSTAHVQQQMDAAHQQAGRPRQPNPMLPQDQGLLESFFQMPQFGQGPGGPQRPAGRDELIAQARFWDIEDPENIDPAQLQQMIQQRRLQMPRDQQTSAGSASLAALGAASEAGTAASRVIGNIFGDIGKLPFAGPALSKILGSEEAKRWMYDLSQKTSEFTEAARAAQPLQDQGAFDVLAASGKVGGYALPAMLTWKALGAAAAAYVPEAWAARVASPIARAAIQGGLTGTILEAGSDEPASSKVISIGLGTALGAATALPIVGSAIGLGAAGAGIGGQVGDTPQERTRNAIIGGIAGAAMGAAPAMIAAGARLRSDFKSPHDAAVEVMVRADPTGAGPRGSGQRYSVPESYPSEPDYVVEPELVVRSDPLETPATRIGPSQKQRLLPEGIPEVPESRNLPAPLSHGKLAGTKVVGEDGSPLTVYHGTGTDFEAFDTSKSSPDNLFGPGFYTTENPQIASGYAGDFGPNQNAIANLQGAIAMYQQSKANYVAGGLSPAVIDQQIAQVQGQIDQLVASTPSPQVKPLRLNIQNPFDIDKTYSPEELRSLVSRLQQANPGYDFNYHLDFLWAGQSHTGEEIYGQLAATPTADPVQGPERRIGSVWAERYRDPGGPARLGKDGLNGVLEQAGYDGITHIGGARTGNEPHRVWIAFRPEQIHSPWDVPDLPLDQTATTADVMTKQATIMESATLPEAMAKTEITDADVAKAALASNPGGVSVVRGVLAPLRVIQEAGPNVSFVQRPNGWDMLVGQVTPQQVKEYTDYGVFTGQKVVTATTGIEGEISGFSRGMVTVKRQIGPPLRIRPENLLPSRFSEPTKQAPQLWDGFKQDLLSYMNHEAEGAGMAPVLGMDDPRVPSMMAERMADYLTRQGITDPAVRQAVDADFNHRWVQDLRELDYEMKAVQDELLAAGAEAHNETEASDSHHIVQSLEEAAEKRGFIWVSKPEANGGSLRDTINPGSPDINIETDEAAHEFLARTDRALPDYTPASDVPLDVAAMLPADLGREPRLGLEDRADNLANTLRRAQAEDVEEVEQAVLGAGGSGGNGGYLPPSGPGAGDLGGRLPGGRGETLPEQFARMRRSDPAKLHAMEERFRGLLDSHLRYTRYAMLRGENIMVGGGLDKARLWSHYEDLSTAHDQAAREGAAWLEEWADIMREFPRKLLRHGEVTRIHEIQDTNERYRAWDSLQRVSKYQLSQERVAQAIRADERITDFNHRFFTMLTGDPAFALTAEREIYRYMSHVRARQAQGVANPYDVPGLSPTVQFFAEHAREGNLQFRVMDARELGNHMVRAAMFKKYEAQPWYEAVSAWDLNKPMTSEASPIPLAFREYLSDYMRLSRFGYDPKGELAVRGIQGVMTKVFKTPITQREAQHMLNMPQGAMYMSMLAGRASIFFRDAIQPLMALAKVEMPYMASTYAKVLKGAGQKLARTDENALREMYHRGLDGGWIQQENPNIEAAGFFEEQPGLRENELLHLTQEQASRRERFAVLGDQAYGLPAWLVRPSESRLSTLRWYAKEGQLNRLVVGESAYQQAKFHLNALRQSTADAVLNLDPTKEISYPAFEERAYFSSFEPPIARKLRDLVQAGDDEGAAQLFAREVANWSQFKYGRKEVPSALRGNIGRTLSMFGSFTGQFLEGMNSALSNGSTRHKVRYGLTIGTVSAAMFLLKHQTGWSFDRWAWVPNAFQYAGSPFLEMGARAVAATSGAVNTSQDRRPSDFESAAMKEELGTPFIGTALEFFPYTGYMRSAQEYSNALHGTNPLEQAARYTITGDRGSAVDIRRAIDEMVQREGHVPEGALSPNGGLMPGRPGSGYGVPQAVYAYPGQQVPGAGAMP